MPYFPSAWRNASHGWCALPAGGSVLAVIIDGKKSRQWSPQRWAKRPRRWNARRASSRVLLLSSLETICQPCLCEFRKAHGQAVRFPLHAIYAAGRNHAGRAGIAGGKAQCQIQRCMAFSCSSPAAPSEFEPVIQSIRSEKDVDGLNVGTPVRLQAAIWPQGSCPARLPVPCCCCASNWAKTCPASMPW